MLRERKQHKKRNKNLVEVYDDAVNSEISFLFSLLSESVRLIYIYIFDFHYQPAVWLLCIMYIMYFSRLGLRRTTSLSFLLLLLFSLFSDSIFIITFFRLSPLLTCLTLDLRQKKELKR